MKETNLFQHYRDEDQVLIEKVLDNLERVSETYSPVLTGFVDPYVMTLYQQLAKRYDVQYFSSNDNLTKEYGRVLIAPDYYVLEAEDFELSLLEVTYATKFNHLSHSQVMGALLHQLGIRRSVFGDILVADERIQLFVDKKMTSYFKQEVTRMGRVPVQLVEKPLDQVIKPIEKVKEDVLLLSSLRLDKVIASAFKLSRTQAGKLITTDKVKRNYRVVTKVADLVEVGDQISVRGFGRFRLVDNLGFTKSGKIKIQIEKTVKS